ncbi:MAG TPA: serine hydrolase [Pseudobacteroides sp.]|uniref:serine hydrolase n=1 Tax=Pseudobacteroides sp. TaxID=1968840 RepID=UPI002F93128C
MASKKAKRIRLIYKRIRFLLILCLLFFMGYQINRMLSGENIIKDVLAFSQQFSKIDSINHQEDNKDNLNGVGSEKTDRIKNELSKYLSGLDGHYGVYYYNLVTRESFGINEYEEFTAASTIKVPINLYLFRKIETGDVNPLGTLKYIRDDFEGGTGIIQSQSFGKKYTIKQLSRLSITHSDNVATNMLLRYLGINNIKNYMRSIGGTVVKDDKNVSCPRDMGIYMKHIYEFSNTNGELGMELMDSLLNTKFNDRIPALLPSNIKVAHKIGTQVNTVNDVGIVFKDNPYIISIMSKEVDENKAPGEVAKISKIVYDLD